MGQLIVDKEGAKNGDEKHSCSKEIPTYGFVHYDGSTSAREQPIGMVFRCSCGVLWVTKRQHTDSAYTIWAKAGWRLRKKYQDRGWIDGSAY